MDSIINIKKLVLEPELSHIADAIEITFTFTVKKVLPSVTWTITYILDYTGKPHVIPLSISDTQSYLDTDAEYKYTVRTK